MMQLYFRLQPLKDSLSRSPLCCNVWSSVVVYPSTKCASLHEVLTLSTGSPHNKSSFHVTIANNYVIAIATLRDWLKNLTLVFQPMRINTKCTLNPLFFSRSEQVQIIVRNSDRFMARCLLLLWLVGVIPLVLVLWWSFENCTICKQLTKDKKKIFFWTWTTLLKQ